MRILSAWVDALSQWWNLELLSIIFLLHTGVPAAVKPLLISAGTLMDAPLLNLCSLEVLHSCCHIFDPLRCCTLKGQYTKRQDIKDKAKIQWMTYIFYTIFEQKTNQNKLSLWIQQAQIMWWHPPGSLKGGTTQEPSTNNKKLMRKVCLAARVALTSGDQASTVMLVSASS